MPYFQTLNASRRYSSDGFIFVFDATDNFGGGWSGVLEVTEEKQLAAIKKLDVNTGVFEITKEEFDRQLAKKVQLPGYSPSSEAGRQSRTAAILDAKVVVRDVATSPIKVDSKEKLKEVEDVLVIGTAEFTDPLDIKLNAKQRKKK